ncbi:FUSC family protein [Leuconostocaceae bacterium ESL0723]|nr:FUSC family protein [Leuconostocaceae bacterium ESL0723]
MNRRLIHAVFGALTISISLAISLLSGNMPAGVMAAFGALLFMYYVPINGPQTFTHFYFIGLIGAGSFIVSALLAALPWVSVIWIGVLTFLVNAAVMRANFKGPGIFFLLMINGMLATLSTLSLTTRLELAACAILGILIATLCALAENQIYDRFPVKIHDLRASLTELNYVIILKSLINAIFIALAFYIGYSLHLSNYYWVLVGATTILQEEQISGGLKKQINCVLAALVGCLASFYLYAYIGNTMSLIGLSILLMFLINFFMPKSYLLGNLFTTPIGLILFKLFRNHLSYGLIYYRLIDLVLGTSIGLIGLLFYQHLFNRIKS